MLETGLSNQIKPDCHMGIEGQKEQRDPSSVAPGGRRGEQQMPERATDITGLSFSALELELRLHDMVKNIILLIILTSTVI